MVGHINNTIIATSSIAVIGITNQPLFIGIALVQALNIGATTIIARLYGANEIYKIEDILKHVLLINIVTIIIPSMFLFIPFVKDILTILGSDKIVLKIGTPYFKLIIISFVFQSLSLSISASLRGVGETKISMKINLISNVFNIVLNFILIYGLYKIQPFGIVGAGISTIISNVFTFASLIYYLLKKNKIFSFNINKKFKCSKDIVLTFFKIGVPASIEQITIRVGILLFTFIVSSLGTNIFAAHNIALNIWVITLMGANAFSISAMTLIGRTIGQKNILLSRKYAKVIHFYGIVLSTIIAILCFVFANNVVVLFSNDNEIIQYASLAIRIMAIVQPFQTSQLILTGVLRGKGDMISPLIVTMGGVLFIRPILAFIFVKYLHTGLLGAWVAIFIDQFVRWILIVLRYKKMKKTLTKKKI